MNIAQPVVVDPPGEGSNVKVQAILETAAAALAVRDLDAVRRTGDPSRADHRKGPLTLAAVATREVKAPTETAEASAGTGTGTGTKKAEARLVVVGDATVASDEVVDASFPNMDFVLNAIGWLASLEEAIAIGSKAPEIIRLRIDEDQKVRLQLISLVTLPLACAAIGLAVFLVRRGA
jgi:hypothetical protein